jgi:hypothetical protein
MTTHHSALRQLIGDGMYVVDERIVAAAVLARAGVNATVAGASFRSTAEPSPIRSFRRDPSARSFRLARTHTTYPHR